MTWNPTHVQFTVLRARNLLTKGKGGMRLTDVFVAIQLGKEKFQTSTIKNATNPEWFEQCDLSIQNMHTDIQVTVMHRGMLSDDFIGYATVPLAENNVFDRPKSQWLQLRGKPHKPPDNKKRGELEVKLTFQVKSKAEDVANNLKKQSTSLKSLASAVGHKVGDKLSKFNRSRSFRENRPLEQQDKRRNSTAITNFSHAHSTTPSCDKIVETSDHQGAVLVSSKMTASTSDLLNFPAVDSNPPEWEETARPSNMPRSYSMTFDKQKNRAGQTEEGNQSYDRPGNRQSLPPSYWGTQTLPHPRGKRYGVLDDSAVSLPVKSADDLNTSVSSQPGYLEAMFKKEREVYKNMQKENRGSSSEDEDRTPTPRRPTNRKTAKEYTEKHSSDSDSEGSVEDIALPVVRRKPVESKGSSSLPDSNDLSSSQGKDSENFVQIPLNNLNQVNTQEDKLPITETAFPESEADHEYHNSPVTEKSDSQGSKEMVNGETTSKSNHSRKKITPAQQFNFEYSPDKQEVQVRRRSKRDRLRQLYKQGGRRYTVQGLDFQRRQYSLEDNLADLRPHLSSEATCLPEDLIAVYKNMTKNELIRLVITHKAQLIRKDQYMKDMEDYIDNLLVRVMESSPRLLQSSKRFN